MMPLALAIGTEKGNKIPSIYGATTSGSIWKFMKLDKCLYIDKQQYYISQLGKILGILKSILQQASKAAGAA